MSFLCNYQSIATFRGFARNAGLEAMTMRKLWTVLFSLLVLCASAYASDGVDIIETALADSASTGMLTFPFTVNNSGNTTLNISFSGTLLNHSNTTNQSLTFTLPAALADVLPGETRSVSAQVDVTDAIVGIYTGTLRAHANAVQDVVPVTVTVQSNGLSLARVDSGTISLTGNPGQTISGSFTARNARNAAFTSTVTSTASFQSPVSQSVPFAAFEQRTVSFTIAIPSGTAVETYAGTVDVIVDGITAFTVPLSISVNALPSVSLPSSISITDDLGKNRSTTFTITNTGNQVLNDLAITFNAASFTDDDGDDISITLTPATDIDLAVGASRTVTLLARIPSDIDAQSYSGTLTVAGSGISRTIPLTIAVQNTLRITDVTVEASGSNSDRKIRPGETFTVNVEVENLADDLDLEDVEVEVFFEDRSGNRLEDDDGDDLDDDAELQDLDAGDDDEVTFTFTMPYDLDDGDTFRVVAVVTARNAEDSSQRFTTRQEEEEIEADKDDHDIEITRASFSQGTLSCDASTTLEIAVRNRGDSDEDVELIVQNGALGISESTHFTLDRDANDPDFEVEERIPVSVRNAQPGTYPFSINARYRGRAKTAVATLTVGACTRRPFDDSDLPDADDRDTDGGDADSDRDGSGSTPIDVRVDDGNQPPVDGAVVRRIDTPTEDFLFTTLLLIANVVMLGVVVLGVMRLKRSA